MERTERLTHVKAPGYTSQHTKAELIERLAMHENEEEVTRWRSYPENIPPIENWRKYWITVPYSDDMRGKNSGTDD